MNGNFEWQKQLANERVQAALQEADEHLRSRRWRRKSFARTAVTQILLGGVGLILIILLISGCTPVSPAILGEASPGLIQNQAAAADASFPLPYSLEDLTRYYARFREEAEAEKGSIVQGQSSDPWSMGDRIRFHDSLLEPVQSQAPWSMADRIRFHDRLQDGDVSLDELDMKDLGNLQRWGLEDRY